MEADPVRMSTHCPDENDVSGERAAFVKRWRHEYLVDPPLTDCRAPEETNAFARTPSGAIDELRIVGDRSRAGRDDEVLGRRHARTNTPTAPKKLCVRAWSGGADDRQLASRPTTVRDQARRDPRRTRDRIPDRPRRGDARRSKLRGSRHERSRLRSCQ